jgi:hypothetical protein
MPESVVLAVLSAIPLFASLTRTSWGRRSDILELYRSEPKGGVYPQDEFFGNLGQGLLNEFKSYTIDFGRIPRLAKTVH